MILLKMNTLTVRRRNIELLTSFLSARTADLAKRGADDLMGGKYDPRPFGDTPSEGAAVLCSYGKSS